MTLSERKQNLMGDLKGKTCEERLHREHPDFFAKNTEDRYSHVCGKPAKMEHEGKCYCGRHDPVKRAAKNAERHARWDRESAIQSAGYEISRCIKELADTVVDELNCNMPPKVLEAANALMDARKMLAELEKP